jgi:hypothetical protein
MKEHGGLLLLGVDAVQLPVVVPIDDVPASPGPGAAESICDVVARVLDDAAPGGSVVIAMVRDSERSVTDSDRQWLTALRSRCADWCASQDVLPGYQGRRPPGGYMSPVPDGPAD